MAEIYTLDGEKIDCGRKPSPEMIGPDDNAAYVPRTVAELKDTPPELATAEVQHLVPIARAVAHAIGIDCLQEVQYGNVIEQLRQRSVFVVLNILKHRIENGVATYPGLVVMCKQHPIVRVYCRCHLATGRWGVSQVHLWSKDASKPGGGEYHIYGSNDKRMETHSVLPLVLEYLENREKVLTLA